MIHLRNSFSSPGSFPFHLDHYCDNPHPDPWKILCVQVGEAKGENFDAARSAFLIRWHWALLLIDTPTSTAISVILGPSTFQHSCYSLYATPVVHYPSLLSFIIRHPRYSLSTTHVIHYPPLLLFIIRHSCYSLSHSCYLAAVQPLPVVWAHIPTIFIWVYAPLFHWVYVPTIFHLGLRTRYFHLGLCTH